MHVCLYFLPLFYLSGPGPDRDLVGHGDGVRRPQRSRRRPVHVAWPGRPPLRVHRDAGNYTYVYGRVLVIHVWLC